MPDPVAPADPPPAGERAPSILQKIFSAGPQGVMQAAGLFLTIVAAFGFVYGIYRLIGDTSLDKISADRPFNFWNDVFIPKFNIIAIVFIGIVSALFAIRLFSKAGSLTSQVIRTEDRELLNPLIRDAKKEAISEYIRLASLSGFVGTFTKLGFTGLPLVTVAVTLILLVIALSIKDDTEMQKSVFDMAKLMLGAFIGSFVQRNVEQEKLIGATASPGPAPVTPLTPRKPEPGGGGADAQDGQTVSTAKQGETKQGEGKATEDKPAEK